jgi:hypothetical protein
MTAPIPTEDRRRGLAAVAVCRQILANHRPTTNPITTTKES